MRSICKEKGKLFTIKKQVMSINRENADIQSEDAMEDPNKKADTKYE